METKVVVQDINPNKVKDAIDYFKRIYPERIYFVKDEKDSIKHVIEQEEIDMDRIAEIECQ